MAGTTGVRWVVDPLDGTTNYLYGLPGFAVSVAVEARTSPSAPVTEVYDEMVAAGFDATPGPTGPAAAACVFGRLPPPVAAPFGRHLRDAAGLTHAVAG